MFYPDVPVDKNPAQCHQQNNVRAKVVRPLTLNRVFPTGVPPVVTVEEKFFSVYLAETTLKGLSFAVMLRGFDFCFTVNTQLEIMPYSLRIA